jgi:hypothetical protein
MIVVPVIKNCAVAVTAMFPLSLPSPARGEGFDPPPSTGGGRGRVAFERNSMRFSPIQPALSASALRQRRVDHATNLVILEMADLSRARGASNSASATAFAKRRVDLRFQNM